MTRLWTVEFDQNGFWYALCHCWSETQGQKMADYFRPMAAFSGKSIRVREYGREYVEAKS